MIATLLPIAMPGTTIETTSRSTSCIIDHRLAPSTVRTPSSFVRRAT